MVCVVFNRNYKKRWTKALYNYSSSLGTNNFSIKLLGESEHPDFMISRLLEPLGTLIWGFEYFKLLQNISEMQRPV